eukprot:scaffold114141_cov31-Tisochrysis_lutea.AAC.1
MHAHSKGLNTAIFMQMMLTASRPKTNCGTFDPAAQMDQVAKRGDCIDGFDGRSGKACEADTASSVLNEIPSLKACIDVATGPTRPRRAMAVEDGSCAVCRSKLDSTGSPSPV